MKHNPKIIEKRLFNKNDNNKSVGKVLTLPLSQFAVAHKSPINIIPTDRAISTEFSHRQQRIGLTGDNYKK